MLKEAHEDFHSTLILLARLLISATFFFLNTIIVVSGILYPFDVWIFRLVNRLSTDQGFAFIMLTTTQLGSTLFWLALMPLLWAYGKRKRDYSILVFIAIVLAISEVLTTLVKEAVARPRPFTILAEITLPAGPSSGTSFPSGHVVRACATTLILAKLLDKSILVAILPALVGVSRVALGVHYPTDVTGGAILGYMIYQMAIMLRNYFHGLKPRIEVFAPRRTGKLWRSVRPRLLSAS